MGYQPISNYGIIGNMRTTALVGLNASIDWYCFPKHDSPSVFAALLDDEKGGFFQITSKTEDVTHKQFYWPETNVLVTRFLSKTAVGEVVDFMPVGTDAPKQWLIRQVRSRRCSMRFRMTCYPAFNYGRDEHHTKLVDEGAIFVSDNLNMALVTDVELQQDDRGVTAEFVLEEGESMAFIFRGVDCTEDCNLPISQDHAEKLFEQTVCFWRSWLSQSVYRGLWRGMVERSALVLKLLTYEPTGAIIAAPTTSLPEDIGGERNWDYRYTWLRDAAFTVYALLRLGFTQEAHAFMGWIERRCHEVDGKMLQVIYTIDGSRELSETYLEHLSGYKNSKPVRLGNGAYDQLQLDIYGELMDSVYLFNKYGTQISYDFWQHLRRLLDYVCDNFYLSDDGVWESRGGREHHVYSKLMCWVALDRGLRLAEKRSFPADRDTWISLRDRIYEEIFEKGWNEELESFVQIYGGDTLDAGCLIMPLVFFMAPNDPRMIKTLERVQKPPREGGLTVNSLVYRYNPQTSSDGLEGREGTFNLCTFWLVEALTRAGKTDPEQLDKARLIFEEMLSYSNHLGLYAEEMAVNGVALGNFPQAFTHIALISAAWNLNETLEAHSSNPCSS
ncbi:glycoside hydrolase family 15 protein [Oscillatoria sp. CS-180]|uniref:glycoside hydrolase family 15 protein n=1 Tax=Oscillatoria sp. CS-180 TaxID=3021720 RepID=UPI0023302B6A|nr:glycoside hydrolase family 15 protein [Oscillatoria sp. CS-180]MDB9527490.1 glycoside hydrolase family 15 protein [Oscillatoria sp. CS-180]